jgi:hypothetical protein
MPLIHMQRLEEQEQNNEQILQLADDMASIITYIEDVEQFARIVQLKKAMEDIHPLIEDTTNFILRYTSRTGTGTPPFLSFNASLTTLFAATFKESLFSSSDRDQIQDLRARFERFKQQFDRGVSVQSALNLEALLTEIGTRSLFTLPKVSNQFSQRRIKMTRCWQKSNRRILTEIHHIQNA